MGQFRRQELVAAAAGLAIASISACAGLNAKPEPVDLRKQALFWRGQKNDASVRDLIALYPRLETHELRDHYVFVLSQRHESDAVDKLIDMARNDPDREIRAKAIFWLGQSKDPRVARFLEERILR